MCWKSPSICVCGGGNIAHSLVAAFGRFGDVLCLTRRPGEWFHNLSFRVGFGSVMETKGKVLAVSDPEIVSGADVVVIALPRFAVYDELNRIEPFLREGQAVVFIPAPAGLDDWIPRLARRTIEVVAFQRVPYVARIETYGRSVWLGDVRQVNRLAISDNSRKDHWKDFFERYIGGHVEFLNSFLTFTFSNSNPLLHPARLVTLLEGGNGGVYRKCPLFYAEWTIRASELYIQADREMKDAFEMYSKSAAMSDYESALAHYESADAIQMTEKIRSIPSLKRILAPWKAFKTGEWGPDYNSRYFTEDVPYGTKVIQQYARKVNVSTPTIDFFVDSIKEVAKVNQ